MHVSSIVQYTLLLLQFRVLSPVNIREAPLLADNDLLSARELVASTTERLLNDRCVSVLAADREDNLSDVHTRGRTVGLAPGATHTSLESTRHRQQGSA